ncbi:MAG: hypothetical protein QXT45_01890 [Candidatus Bilamarchaeaceae archaeon]
MRGYFTFVIVFAAYLLLISLAQFNTNAKTSNLGATIWVERYYQVQMNAKEAIIEAAREGAKEGVTEYTTGLIGCADRKCIGQKGGCAVSAAACLTGAGCAITGSACANYIRCMTTETLSTFSYPCVKRKINFKAVEKIKSLNNVRFDPEIDASIKVKDVEDCRDVCNPDNTQPRQEDLVVTSDADLSFLGDKDFWEKIFTGRTDINNTIYSLKGNVIIGDDRIVIILERPGWKKMEVEMPTVYEEIG